MKLKVIALTLLLSFSPALAQRGRPALACKGEIVNRIRAAIRSTYGQNLQVPDLTVRRKKTGKDDAAAIMADIARNLNIEQEQIDPQIDYSFVYTITEREGTRKWRLCISMVGRFATLFLLSKAVNGQGEVKKVIANATNQSERNIIGAATANRYEFVDEATLGCSTSVRMPVTVENGGQDRVRFWQALFRDETALPF